MDRDFKVMVRLGECPMLTRIRDSALALVAIGGLAWSAAPARADLVLGITVVNANGTTSATADMNTVTQAITSSSGPGLFSVDYFSTQGASQLDYTGAINGVQFSLTATASNSPGSTQFGELSFGTATITNPTTAKGGSAATITIAASDTGFFQPLGPALLQNSTSGTGSGTLTAGTFISSADHQAGTPLVFVGTNGLSGTNFSIASGPNTAGVVTASQPYTVNELYQVALTAGSSLKSAGGLATLSAVPEPSTVVTALAGLPVFGFLAWRRRMAKA
jgi:hypothetical protein